MFSPQFDLIRVSNNCGRTQLAFAQCALHLFTIIIMIIIIIIIIVVVNLINISDLAFEGSGHLRRADKELIRSIGPIGNSNTYQHHHHHHHHHHDYSPHDHHHVHPPGHDKDDGVRRQIVQTCLILAHWPRELLTQHPLDRIMMMIMTEMMKGIFKLFPKCSGKTLGVCSNKKKKRDKRDKREEWSRR